MKIRDEIAVRFEPKSGRTSRPKSTLIRAYRTAKRIENSHRDEAGNHTDPQTCDDPTNDEGREFGVQLKTDSESEDDAGGDESELSSQSISERVGEQGSDEGSSTERDGGKVRSVEGERETRKTGENSREDRNGERFV